MRLTFSTGALLCALATTCAAGDKTKLVVHSVSHESQAYRRSMDLVTPGTSSTNCSGTATTVGGTTTASSNCQTTSYPAQNRRITATTLFVRNVVEGEGKRYVIACKAGWVGSKCAPMQDGDYFPAEINGTTMWIEARRGGNQGKKVRVRYKILDIRPVEEAR